MIENINNKSDEMIINTFEEAFNEKDKKVKFEDIQKANEAIKTTDIKR